MTVEGEKIGANFGSWNHVLNNDFVNAVHLAQATPWREDPHRGVTHFDHAGKEYLRAANGHVYRRVDSPNNPR
jgi:hypothetical protein